MMKKVGFSRFKPLDVTRKVQQCLRFEGNANGDANSDNNKCSANQIECDCSNVLSGEDFPNEASCEDHRNKSNILNAIRKKWRKSKRSKCCDALPNICQCHNSNCDLRFCCAKHFKARKQKPGEKNNMWPLHHSTILRCNVKSEDSTQLITSTNDESDFCSCIGSQTFESDFHADESTANLICSRIHSCNSHSLSNITNEKENSASSLASKTQSIESSRASSIGINGTIDTCVCENPDCVKTDFAGNQTVTQINAYEIIPRVGNLTQELYKLSKYGWYWGPINRNEAESKLIGQPDGAFLVRDSSDDRYILSLSFRSYGKTLHTRIEHSHGMFSFYSQPEPEGHPSIVELIKQSMCYSQSGVFCYSRSRSPGSPSFPVRLTKPISRFTQIRSLQYLCRFVIRQFTRYDHIQKLPLPLRIKGYLEEGHY